MSKCKPSSPAHRRRQWAAIQQVGLAAFGVHRELESDVRTGSWGSADRDFTPAATIGTVTSTDPVPAHASASGEPQPVLTDIWQGDDDAGFDAERSNAKVCRNARHFTFDGYIEDGVEGDEDVASSWRKLLEREGKSSGDGTSLRDLVLGPTSGD